MTTVDIARNNWELQNEIVESDELYSFDPEANSKIVESRPWKGKARYFKSVWISSVALMKMVIHARSGGRLEIIGVMQGKIMEDKFMIMDAFALPVIGTETRVNPGAEANAYMVTYQEESEKICRSEPIVGWYHSHPGYGCWLSGIDVETQKLYQQHQDPFVAIVIDPLRTCAAGKVEIKAFRCFPPDFPRAQVDEEGVQFVPANKIQDFGKHWREYYNLPITIFKSKTDDQLFNLLWATHWTSTLLSSTLIENSEYRFNLIQDLRRKAETLEASSCVRGTSSRGLERLLDQLKKLGHQSGENAIEDIEGLCSILLMKATLRPSNESMECISQKLLARLAACSDLDLLHT